MQEQDSFQFEDDNMPYYELKPGKPDELKSVLTANMGEHITRTLTISVSEALMEKKVQMQVPQFSIEHTLNSALVTHDECDIDNDCDFQPQQFKPESWIRNQMNFIHKEALFKPTLDEIVYDPIDSAKESIKKQAKPKPNSRLPEALVNQTEYFDIQEESLRSQKERDDVMREQKRLQQKQIEEIKQQQYKLNFSDNKRDKTNFTYDFDGNVIVVQAPKQDKLPVQLQQIRYNFGQEHQPEKKQQALIKLKRKQNFKPTPKTGADEGIKYTPNPPSINEVINPKSGVTFVQGNFQKKGPNRIESNFDFNDLNTLLEESSIKLSKNDYKKLTQQGNLSRDQFLPATQHQQNQQDTILVEVQDETRMKTSSQEITMHNQQLLEQFMSEQNELKHSNLFNIQNQYEVRLPRLQKPRNRSMVDEFNQNILKNAQWGVTANNSYRPNQTQRPLKHQNIKNVDKMPRERQNIKIVQQLSKHEHLPAPRVGNTMGHGLEQGQNIIYDVK